MRRTSLACVALGALVVLASFVVLAQDQPAAPVEKKDIVATLAAKPEFSKLVHLLQVAGLSDTLKTMKGVTVLAPTDAAFAALPKETLDSLTADPVRLRAVLTYHVVMSELKKADIEKAVGQQFKTMNGLPISVTKTDAGEVLIGGAKVVVADQAASNGIIQGINKVIMPPAQSVPPAVTK